MRKRTSSENHPYLTDKRCTSIQPSNKVEEFVDGPTVLVLRVTPTGHKSWTMRYRLKSGEQKRVTLGSFPTLSLAKAREALLKIQLDLASGKDPSEEKRIARLEAMGKIGKETLDDVAHLYFEACRHGRHKVKVNYAKSEKTIKEEMSVFSRLVPYRFKKLKLDSILPEEIELLLSAVERENGPSSPRSVRAVLQGIFNYAVYKDIVQKNPMPKVGARPSKSRRVMLNNQKIREFWNAFDSDGNLENRAWGEASTGIALRLCLVLGQRRGEIAKMRVSNLDQKEFLWTIPPEDSKNRRAHVVPLPPMARRMVADAIRIRSNQTSEYVFPGWVNIDSHIGPGTMTQAFTRACDKFEWGDYHLHDLRRTVATNMTKPPLSIRKSDVSKVLNHTSVRDDAAPATDYYDMYEYLNEKKNALLKWEKRLVEILNEADDESSPGFEESDWLDSPDD